MISLKLNVIQVGVGKDLLFAGLRERFRDAGEVFGLLIIVFFFLVNQRVILNWVCFGSTATLSVIFQYMDENVRRHCQSLFSLSSLTDQIEDIKDLEAIYNIQERHNRVPILLNVLKRQETKRIEKRA